MDFPYNRALILVRRVEIVFFVATSGLYDFALVIINSHFIYALSWFSSFVLFLVICCGTFYAFFVEVYSCSVDRCGMSSVTDGFR